MRYDANGRPIHYVDVPTPEGMSADVRERMDKIRSRARSKGVGSLGELEIQNAIHNNTKAILLLIEQLGK